MISRREVLSIQDGYQQEVYHMIAEVKRMINTVRSRFLLSAISNTRDSPKSKPTHIMAIRFLLKVEGRHAQGIAKSFPVPLVQHSQPDCDAHESISPDSTSSFRISQIL